MPGIRPLLDTLASRDDVYLALLTGNYQKAARLKLEHFDLWRYFPCGAFADDAADRNSLLPKALERIRACGGPSVGPPDVIVVGDTPHDVACALAAGARPVGVATGSFSAGAA
jgi:phosphoglycolate phosphatase-like HAD superfamily hydrolase